ncbi:MAG: hypothetical protein AB7N80_07290 [Bdellovibrionales bacterium]
MQWQDLVFSRVGLDVIRRYTLDMRFLFLILISLSSAAWAAPTWQQGESIPIDGRANPYDLGPEQLVQVTRAGRLHALVYPVSVTGALLPLRPIQNFLDEPTANPLRALLQGLSRAFSKIESFDQAMNWLGLHPYPENAGQPESDIPLPPGMRAGQGMGLSLLQSEGVTGFTFSCAACHSAELFGRPVLGMTNRFPRANAFFILGKQVTQAVMSPLFSLATGANRQERLMYRRTRHNMFYVGSKRPEVLGLDTSLSHVALSLARRQRDAYASKDSQKPWDPDDEPLATLPADSKPAVWWNLKYKNRWLSDGSVLSGNPIVTNILWNEIGRGTDLRELEQWLEENRTKVEELTTAVFASKAPRITEFFTAESIDLQAAQRGQQLFSRRCAHCHGQYEKAWDQPNFEQLPYAEQLRTTRVVYHAQTPVIDVGTDAFRREGMRSLESLNKLAISQRNGVTVLQQPGYVPPPLVGIWARWPYFHNNSAPNLCAVLMPANERPEFYYAGEAQDRDRDFDFACNGYPLGSATPASWQTREYRYDTNRPGLSRQGHEIGGLTAPQRLDVIQFLQTL